MTERVSQPVARERNCNISDLLKVHGGPATKVPGHLSRQTLVVRAILRNFGNTCLGSQGQGRWTSHPPEEDLHTHTHTHTSLCCSWSMWMRMSASLVAWSCCLRECQMAGYGQGEKEM